MGGYGSPRNLEEALSHSQQQPYSQMEINHIKRESTKNNDREGSSIVPMLNVSQNPANFQQSVG